jgi:cysteine desulfurase
VAAALEPGTVLVSVMAAQNEIGTVQPVVELGALCKERGVLFHVDAAQAVGKIPVDVAATGIDLLSLSGHKLYAPKGVGALYVRRRAPRVALAPLLEGGGQERGLRAGTLNVPGIVALGEACRLAGEEMAGESARLVRLRDRLLAAVRTGLDGVHLNGDATRRLPGHLNLSFAGVRAHRLLGALTVLAVSSSSACSSADTRPSPILAALGVPEELARASLRLSLGRFTTEEEVDFAAERIVAAVAALRRENPI